MPRAKIYTPEEAKQRNRESRQRYEAKYPEKLKAKREKENKRIRDRRAEVKRAKISSRPVKPTTRVCKKCSIEKPLDSNHFKRHSQGHGFQCLICSPMVSPREAEQNYRAKKAPDKKAKVKKELPKFVLTTERKVKEPSKAPVSDESEEGWILICGTFANGGVGVTAKMKDGVLKIGRANSVASYMIMGDMSGATFRSYALAIREIERQQAKES